MKHVGMMFDNYFRRLKRIYYFSSIDYSLNRYMLILYIFKRNLKDWSRIIGRVKDLSRILKDSHRSDFTNIQRARTS